MYASEAREDFELPYRSWFSESDFDVEDWLDRPGRECWFFLLQSMLAVSHLTDCQHCDVETISYAGVINGKHTWLARA